MLRLDCHTSGIAKQATHSSTLKRSTRASSGRYVWRPPLACSPSASLVCTLVQEDIIPFFQQVTFSDEDTDVYSCMTSLAAQVRDGLKTLDPYFEKLADGMLAWVDAWRMLNNKLV